MAAPHFTNRIAALSVVTMLLTQLLPSTLAAPAGDKKEPSSPPSPSPQQEQPAPTDWSSIDWKSSIVLPHELEAYQREVDKLSAQKKFDAIKKLKKPAKQLKDKAVLDHFAVPSPVRSLVEEISDAKELKNRLQLFSQLNKNLAPAPPTEELPKIDLSKERVEQLRALSHDAAGETRIDGSTKLEEATVGQFKLAPIELPAELDVSKKTFWDSLKLFFVPPARAQGAPELMPYYAGIEKNQMDFALYFLSKHQNANGSFGPGNDFVNTMYVIDALTKFGRQNNAAFQAAVAYALSYQPTTTEEFAHKIRILRSAGRNYDLELQKLLSARNADGGFGYSAGDASDVVATVEAGITLAIIQHADSAPLLGALVFVSSKVRDDGSMYFFRDSNPNYYLTARTLELFYPVRNATIEGDNGVQIRIGDKVNAMLNFLQQQHAPGNGMRWSTDAVDSAIVARLLRQYGVAPAIVTDLSKYVATRQGGSGGFDDDVLSTLHAMHLLARPDLVATDIRPEGNLVNRQPGSVHIVIQNRGYAPASGTDLYIFADKLKFAQALNLEAAGVRFDPNAQVDLNVGLPTTVGLIGSTEFLAYAEPDDDLSYVNNWYGESLNVASDPGGRPSLPLYYIAQKYESGGNFGLNVRWQPKPDANRLGYIIAWRPKGTAGWNTYFAPNHINGYFLTSAFSEGTVYEVTAGALYQNGSTVELLQPYTDVQVSSAPANYLGRVEAFVTEDEKRAPGMGTQGYAVVGQTSANGDVVYQNVPNGSSSSFVESPSRDALRTNFSVPRNGTTQNVRIFTRLKDDAEPPQVRNLYAVARQQTRRLLNQYEETLRAEVSDNTEVKEVDFYYYDPREPGWFFIGTASTQYNQVADLPWMLPNTLIGEGFQLKAVARDHRGNESAPRTWGPLTIVSGAPPRFTVVSPNGGEQLTVGGTHTVRWTTEAANSVARVDIAVIYPNGPETLRSGVANTGSYDLQIPNGGYYASDRVRIRVSGQDALNYQFGSDESDGELAILDLSPPPASPWDAPTRVTDDSEFVPAGGTLASNALRYDRNGVAHEVYRFLHDAFGEPRIITEKLIHRQKNANGWSAPETIYERLWQTDNSLNGFAPVTEMRIEIDNDNNPVVAWRSSPNGNGCSVFNGAEIFTLRRENGQWLAPENVSQNNTDSRAPDLTVDADGGIHVTWVDGRSWNDACQSAGNSLIRYRKKPAGQGWNGVEELAQFPEVSFPEVVSTVDRRVHIVYYDGVGRAFRHIAKAPNNNWAAVATVYEGDLSYHPDLRSRENNLYWISQQWYTDPATQQGRTRLIYSDFTNDQWSALQEAAPGAAGEDAQFPKLAIDGNGNPHIAFMHIVRSPQRTTTAWRTRINGQWLAISAVSLPSQIPGDYSIAFDSDGVRALTVSWLAYYSRAVHLFANRADLNRDFIAPAPPANVRMRSRPGAVSVLWDGYANPDGDARVLRIYRTTNNATRLSTLQPIGEVNNLAVTEYLDRTAAPGTSYYYGITSADAANNENKSVSWVGPVIARPAPRQTLIRDGSMEVQDLAAWRAWGRPTRLEKSEISSDSPTRAMYLDARGRHAGFQQLNVPVQAGKRYRYALSYRLLANGNIVPRLETNLGIRSSNTDFESKPGLLRRISDEWQIYTREFTVPATFAGDFRVVIRIRDGEGFVDDVMLEEIPAGALVSDGDMEAAGLGVWRNYGLPVLFEKTPAVRQNGLQSMHIVVRGNSGGQQLNIPLQPGRQYRFRASYRLTGTLIPQISSTSSNRDFEFDPSDPRVPLLQTTNGEWRTYERTFTTPANYAGTYRVVFITSNTEFIPNVLYRVLPQGEVWIDDVSIEPVN